MICNVWYETDTCSTPRYNWNIVESGVKHHKLLNASHTHKTTGTRLILNNKQVQTFLVLSINDCFINKLKLNLLMQDYRKLWHEGTTFSILLLLWCWWRENVHTYIWLFSFSVIVVNINYPLLCLFKKKCYFLNSKVLYHSDNEIGNYLSMAKTRTKMFY